MPKLTKLNDGHDCICFTAYRKDEDGVYIKSHYGLDFFNVKGTE